MLHIPQSSSITGTSPSDCLVSYAGHSLRKSCLTAEVQSVYSTVPADRDPWTLVVGGVVLPFCREAIAVHYCPSQLGHQDTCCGSGGLTLLPRSSCCILQPQPTWTPGHLWEVESYPSAEKQSLYSTVPADLDTRTLVVGGGVLHFRREAVAVFYSPIQIRQSIFLEVDLIVSGKSVGLYHRGGDITPAKKHCPWYDTKTASDGEAQVLVVWQVWNTKVHSNPV